MKALALRHFTMGSRNYSPGQEINLDPERITRLIGEGLAKAAPHVAPLSSEPTPPPAASSPIAEQPAKVGKANSRSKKR